MERWMSFSLSPGSSAVTTSSFLVSYMSAAGAHTRSASPAERRLADEVVEEPVHLGLDVGQVARQVLRERTESNQRHGTSPPVVRASMALLI